MSRKNNLEYERELTDCVDWWWGSHFRGPTYREIVEGTSIQSTSTARRVAHRLYGKPKKGGSRSIIPEWVENAIKKASEG